MGRKAGLSSEDVIEAAVALANREGFDAVTLAALADDLGIRPPSLYNHVDGLDGLNRELMLRANRTLERLLAEETDGLHDDKALRGCARGYRRFALEYPGLFPCLSSGRRLREDPELWAATVETLAPFVAATEECGHTGDDLWEYLRILRSALFGFLTIEVNRGFGYGLDPAESYDRLVDVLLSGLAEVGLPGEL